MCVISSFSPRKCSSAKKILHLKLFFFMPTIEMSKTIRDQYFMGFQNMITSFERSSQFLNSNTMLWCFGTEHAILRLYCPWIYLIDLTVAVIFTHYTECDEI